MISPPSHKLTPMAGPVPFVYGVKIANIVPTSMARQGGHGG